MAVRVADSLKQQNDLKTFPVAYSEDIWLDENKGEGDANFKDLQTLFNENKLGGSGLPEPESADKVLLSASSNTRADGLEWKQVSKNEVGLQLPEFESLEEWDSLPAEEKSKYYNAGKGYVVIKEDVKGAKGVIDDTKPTSTVTTLSAKKINDSLVDIESKLETKVNDRRKLLSTISMTTTEQTLAIEDISDYKYFEIVAAGSSRVRGSIVLPKGLTATGAVITCFYDSNVYGVNVNFPTNTSVKVKTNKAEIDMLYIYGIAY